MSQRYEVEGECIGEPVVCMRARASCWFVGGWLWCVQVCVYGGCAVPKPTKNDFTALISESV